MSEPIFTPDGENQIPTGVLYDFKLRTVVEVLNPRWSNEDHTMFDADILFQELAPMGHIPFTATPNADTDHGQEVWDKGMNGTYGVIAEYVAPVIVPFAPDEISRRQFFQQLAVAGIISKIEALAAMKSGAVPQALQAIIDALPTDEDRFNAEMLVIGADTFNRTHALTETVRLAMQWTEEQRDQFWQEASKL